MKVGYFSQHRVEMLNVRQTVLESVLDMPNPVSEQTARTVLGSFLFRGDDVFKTGRRPERRRKNAARARQAAARSAEPPAHGRADDASRCRHDRRARSARSSSTKARSFSSATTCISSARSRRSVLHINAGQLTPYAGDYQYYLDKSKATSARAALTAGTGLTNLQPVVAGRVEAGPVSAPAQQAGLREQKEQKRAEAEVRKAVAKIRREHEQRVRELEMQIATLEGRQKELTAELENPSVYEPAVAPSRSIANSPPSRTSWSG